MKLKRPEHLPNRLPMSSGSRFESGKRIVGHRGGRGEDWPAENTLAAFEEARARGAKAVEFDVRLAGDGRVVVFHDADLARMTSGRDLRRVYDLTTFDLSRIELVKPGQIPELAEVLAWAREQDMSLNIELKQDVPSRRALAKEVARAVASSRVDFVISSFDPAIVAMMRALLPTERVAQLTSAQARNSRWLWRACHSALMFAVHLERVQTDPDIIRTLKARGLRIGAWTVNNPQEAADLFNLGVDYIITDCCDEILATLTVSNT